MKKIGSWYQGPGNSEASSTWRRKPPEPPETTRKGVFSPVRQNGKEHEGIVMCCVQNMGKAEEGKRQGETASKEA